MTQPANLGDVLRSHVSVREYLDEPVAEDVRKRILEATFAASSTCFLQMVDVIRITDHDKRRRLMELSGNQKQVLDAPEFWVFCADYRRNAELVAEADLGWSEQLVAATLDVGICAQTAMAALEAEGLGGCFIGGLRNGVAEVDKLLELPQDVIPLLGLAFGHPAYKNEQKPRLPLSVTVMENCYCRANPETLADYDARMHEYFGSRAKNPRDDTWVNGIEAVLKRERRPFVGEFLKKKGYALK